MTAVALVVAALAIILAYFAWNRGQALSREVAQTHAQLLQLRAELGETRTTLQGKLDDLCQEARRQAGELKFAPNMTIADALQVHPRVAQVLSDYELGGCSNCAVSDVDTLEGACRSYGIDQDALMGALNRLLAEPADSGKPIKIGGMRVEL
jgi:hybrid cluster-associated redox disulfide protein